MEEIQAIFYEDGWGELRGEENTEWLASSNGLTPLDAHL